MPSLDCIHGLINTWQMSLNLPTIKVFLEESLEKKPEYLKHYQADILVMGDDWQGKFDSMKEYCDVVYLPRTPSISTTEIIEVVKSL